MAEIVNLNKARKAKARQQHQVTAAANRIAFGRSKAERDAARQEAERARREVDGKKLDDNTSDTQV